jgi:hypothetical protein
MKNQYVFKRGDIVFFCPQNWLEKIIAYFDGKYFHTGIMLTDKLILSQTYRGLSIENIYEEYKGYKVDVFQIKNTSWQKIDKIIRFIMSTNYPYDYSGVLNFIFKWIPNNPRRFYCSEIIAFTLIAFGYYIDDVKLSPLQLSNQECLEYITTIQL